MRTHTTFTILCAAALLTLTGCASNDGALPASGPTETQEAPAEASAVSAGDIADEAETRSGPVDTYLEWLAASREPNAQLACAMLSDGLQLRMLAEAAASLGSAFANCEAMITETAAMYAAVGASAEVDVEVVSETSAEATLFSTYVDTGNCGTIHLTAVVGSWLITEQSEECAA